MALLFLLGSCEDSPNGPRTSISAGPGESAVEIPANGDRAAALPWFERAQSSLARVAGELEALAALDHCLELDPRFVEARVVRSQLRSREGPLLDLAVALGDSQIATALRPDEPSLWIGEALIRYHMGDVGRACVLAERYLAEDSQGPSGLMKASAHELLGYLRMHSGELDAASEHLERAHEAAPRRVEILVGLGKVAEEKKDLESARARYDAAVGLEPAYLPARWARLRVLSRLHCDEDVAREQRVCELLRVLTDSTATAFLRDHARKAGCWKELAGLDPVPEFHLREAKERFLARDLQGVIDVLGRAAAPDFELLSVGARAYAGAGRLDEARGLVTRMKSLDPPPPAEAIAGLEREIAQRTRPRDSRRP